MSVITRVYGNLQARKTVFIFVNNNKRPASKIKKMIVICLS